MYNDKKVYVFVVCRKKTCELVRRGRPTFARLIKVSSDQLTSIMRECVSTFMIAYEIPPRYRPRGWPIAKDAPYRRAAVGGETAHGALTVKDIPSTEPTA